jgi:hypothetical protein
MVIHERLVAEVPAFGRDSHRKDPLGQRFKQALGLPGDEGGELPKLALESLLLTGGLNVAEDGDW